MDDEHTLTPRQVAEILGVDRSTVSRLKHEKLPFRRTPGGQRLYRPDDVERYRQGLVGPTPTPSLEERVKELESWRTRHEQEHTG